MTQPPLVMQISRPILRLARQRRTPPPRVHSSAGPGRRRERRFGFPGEASSWPKWRGEPTRLNRLKRPKSHPRSQRGCAEPAAACCRRGDWISGGRRDHQLPVYRRPEASQRAGRSALHGTPAPQLRRPPSRDSAGNTPGKCRSTVLALMRGWEIFEKSRFAETRSLTRLQAHK